MLNILKKSDLCKKILVSTYLFITFIILLKVMSPKPTQGFYLISYFFIFFLLSFIIYTIDLKDWIKLNINYLKKNIKLMLYFFGCLVIGLTSVIDYLDAFRNILTLSSIFIFGIFTFISLTNNKNDVILSFNLLKIFSGVFIFMSVMLYTTYKDALLFQNDYYKTKISSENEIEKKESIKEYKFFIDSILRIYAPDEINVNSENKIIKIEKRKFHLFTNIASTIIIITIIMCTIFLITNSSLFKINKEKRILYKNHRKKLY